MSALTASNQAQSVPDEIKLFNYVCIIVFTVEINEYMNFKCENDQPLNLRWINTLMVIIIIAREENWQTAEHEVHQAAPRIKTEFAGNPKDYEFFYAGKALINKQRNFAPA